jgi:hydroxymethylbilane synthase
MPDVRIATRSSRLALAQARIVATALTDAHPDIEIELIEVTTTGDRDATTPVAALSEVGAFVRSVQQTVLDGEADMAVHSGKDLPVGGPEGLAAVHPGREEPWDVLCGSSLETLKFGARVGTGSPRRGAQLRRLRPDIAIAEIRGNVETRLRKLDEGDFDAIVLAEAGLRRLGLTDRIDHRSCRRPRSAHG